MLVSRRQTESPTPRYVVMSPLAAHSHGGLHSSRSHSPSPSCSIGGGLSPVPTCYRTVGARPTTPRAPAKYYFSSSTGGVSGSNGSTPQMVAIDSKIEQAMDLVKTHLMFAVREEVEVLRGRIVDLENTVCHLEAENAVLRQHVSDEILRNLSLHGN